MFSGLQTGPRPTSFSITNEANAGPINGLRPDYMTSPTNIFSQLNTNICKQAWSGPKFLARYDKYKMDMSYSSQKNGASVASLDNSMKRSEPHKLA